MPSYFWFYFCLMVQWTKVFSVTERQVYRTCFTEKIIKELKCYDLYSLQIYLVTSLDKGSHPQSVVLLFSYSNLGVLSCTILLLD